MSPAEAAAPLRLGLRDAAPLARIAALWPVAAVSKRSLALPALARRFDAAPPPADRAGRGGAHAGGTVPPWRLARLIDGLLRRAYRSCPGYCVERSLLLFHLLRRDGRPARLCFGVEATAGGGLAGHAWVELDGEPVAERRDPRERYRTTYAYPEGGVGDEPNTPNR